MVWQNGAGFRLRSRGSAIFNFYFLRSRMCWGGHSSIFRDHGAGFHPREQWFQRTTDKEMNQENSETKIWRLWAARCVPSPTAGSTPCAVLSVECTAACVDGGRSRSCAKCVFVAWTTTMTTRESVPPSLVPRERIFPLDLFDKSSLQ